MKKGPNPMLQDILAFGAIALFVFAVTMLGALAELLILAGRAV